MAECLYKWLQAPSGTTTGTIECQDELSTQRVKRHSGKSSTQSIKKLKTRARGPNQAKPRVAATKKNKECE